MNINKNKLLSILSSAAFAFLSLLVLFPVVAGALASFRPGRELIRRGLSINLDFFYIVI